MSNDFFNSNQISGKSLKDNAVLVYVLYLVNLVIPFVGIVGVIIAYANNDKAPSGPRSHFIFQIHTFWLGLLYSVIVGLLCMVFIGFFLIPLLYVWIIARCVIGLMRASENRPIDNPRNWITW